MLVRKNTLGAAVAVVVALAVSMLLAAAPKANAAPLCGGDTGITCIGPVSVKPKPPLCGGDTGITCIGPVSLKPKPPTKS
jgi:hypothetical protein